MEKLRDAEVTVFYALAGGKNDNGQHYIRLLPYVKVRLRNIVTGAYDGETTAYLPHDPLQLELQRLGDVPYRLVMEKAEEGAFPTNASKGSNLSMTDTIELHQFNTI